MIPREIFTQTLLVNTILSSRARVRGTCCIIICNSIVVNRHSAPRCTPILPSAFHVPLSTISKRKYTHPVSFFISFAFFRYDNARNKGKVFFMKTARWATDSIKYLHQTQRSDYNLSLFLGIKKSISVFVTRFVTIVVVSYAVFIQVGMRLAHICIPTFVSTPATRPVVFSRIFCNETRFAMFYIVA